MLSLMQCEPRAKQNARQVTQAGWQTEDESRKKKNFGEPDDSGYVTVLKNREDKIQQTPTGDNMGWT